MAPGQLLDAGYQPAGGEADVAHPDVDALGAGDQLQKIHHVVKVVQRFPDAHQNHMGHPLAGVLPGGIDFRRNFAGGQVTDPARLGGSAEAAAHGTAHLGGDADRVPVVVAHENRLDTIAVDKLQKIFYRAVPGLLAAADDGRRDGAVLFQPGDQIFGLVGHGGKIGHLLLMEPFKNLFGTERRLADGLDIVGQFGQRQVGKTDFLHIAGLFHQKFTSVPRGFRGRLHHAPFQHTDKKAVRAGFVGEEQGSVLPRPHPGQGNLRRNHAEIRVLGQKLPDLFLVLKKVHCTGRIHQTAVLGKIPRAILEDFLLYFL